MCICIFTSMWNCICAFVFELQLLLVVSNSEWMKSILISFYPFAPFCLSSCPSSCAAAFIQDFSTATSSLCHCPFLHDQGMHKQVSKNVGNLVT